MTELRYCLQQKIKWYDGNSWWATQNFSDSLEHLQNDCLPLLKKANEEEKARQTFIEGYEYRIVVEIVMLGDL